MTTLWKAEITAEMLFHLTSEQQRELLTKLRIVDDIAAEYQVGKEYKHEQ